MEWNSGMYERLRLDEILQIGAVKVSGPRGNIVDTINLYIRPQLHKRYSPAAGSLPDLQLSLDSQLDFPAAAKKFFDWCGEDRQFAIWGGNDLTVLLRNLKHWKLDYDLPETYLDFQRCFSQYVGTGNCVALERALEYCGVPEIFDPHNALFDAVYTWMVCRDMPQELWKLGVCQVTDGRKPAPLPKRPTPWKGPFDSLSGLLSSRGCRRGACPNCGRGSSVSQWYPGPKGVYYGAVRCGCHQDYYLKLEVQRRGGRYWGNTKSLPAQGAALAYFQQELAHREPVPCKSLKPKKHRWWSRRKKKAAP